MMVFFCLYEIFCLYLYKLKIYIMLGKIIQALLILLSFGMFGYSYFNDGTAKDLIFWGVILLLNFIGKCTDNIIEG